MFYLTGFLLASWRLTIIFYLYDSKTLYASYRYVPLIFTFPYYVLVYSLNPFAQYSNHQFFIYGPVFSHIFTQKSCILYKTGYQRTVFFVSPIPLSLFYFQWVYLSIFFSSLIFWVLIFPL